MKLTPFAFDGRDVQRTMVDSVEETRHAAKMDVCLAGVFVGRGEAIPPELCAAWRRRLSGMGLDLQTTMESEAAP